MFDLNIVYSNEKDCYFRVTKLPGKTKHENISIMSQIEGPVCNVNIDIPEINYPEEVVIKDYSENKGLLSEMIRIGLVDEPHAYITVGYAQAPVCKLHYDVLEAHRE